MAKISVILCVYNTPKDMLSACLSSICNSTFRDIEVVIIDDGSTIDYSDIIDKCSFKMIYHKTENKGTLSARLAGLELATSKFIYFIDSDDAISFNYLEGMIKKQEITNADIVINDWAFQTERTKFFCKNDTTIRSDFSATQNETLNLFFKQSGYEHSYYVLWNKLFSKNILIKVAKKIKEMDLPKTCFSEDVLINYFAYGYAKKVVNTHVGYYYYRVHEQQNTAPSNKCAFKHQIISMILVFNKIEEDLNKTGKFRYYKSDFIRWKELMFATHSTIARKRRYADLYETIKRLYCKKRLAKKMPKGASRSYDKQKLLPSNICKIDKVLKNIYDEKERKVVYARKGSYGEKQLISLIKYIGHNNITITHKKKFADIILPKDELPLLHRLIHNYVIFKISLVLFPKGSKIRRYLKSKL